MSTIKPTGPSVAGAPIAQVASGHSDAVATVSGGDPTRSVFAALAAGELRAAEVTARLASEAAAKSGATGDARLAVEARLRTLIESDPVIAALLRRAAG